MKKIILVLALLLIAGCASTEEPVNGATGEEIYFSHTIEDGIIHYEASIPKPTPCHSLSYNVVSDGEIVSLNVDVVDETSADEMCIQVIEYEDVSGNLEYEGETLFNVVINGEVSLSTELIE